MPLLTPEQKAERATHSQRWAAGADLGLGRTVRFPTPKQTAFLKRLVVERALPDNVDPIVAKRVADVADGWTPNLKLASDLIDFLVALPKKETTASATVPASTASPKAVDFLTRLLAERQAPADFVTKCRAKIAAGISRQDASAAIDWLTRQPRVEAPATSSGPVTPGVYKVGDEIFIVKPNREKTRVYAKRLVELTAAQGDRLSEQGDHVRIEFVYAAGAIHRIRPEHRMSVEEGKALTIRYGRCICCGRGLKVAQSVERGIGPVCIKYFAA